MSEKDTSGNRWENEADTDHTDGATAVNEPVAEPVAGETPVVAARTRPDWVNRKNGTAAAAAVGVLLIGGAAGFALGHATGDGHDGRPGISGHGFHGGDRDGRGFAGPGERPGSSDQSDQSDQSDSQS